MRGSVKVKDHWQIVTLSDDPEMLWAWMWAHDGRDAVCIDDRKQVYYCATEDLQEKYKKGGKKTGMFYDLAKTVHKKLKPRDPATSLCYCRTKGLICSEIGECGGEC